MKKDVKQPEQAKATEGKRSRRGMLVLGAAVAGGALAALAKEETASAHGTHFESSTSDPAIHAVNNNSDSEAFAIYGQRQAGADGSGTAITGFRTGMGNGAGVGGTRGTEDEAPGGFGDGVIGFRQGAGDGNGVFGNRDDAGDGYGVRGIVFGTGTGAGVRGDRGGNFGMLGVGPAVGASSPDTGVYGLGTNIGVRGASANIGAYGSGGQAGAIGESSAPAGKGVHARHLSGGTALRVDGRSSFSTVGIGTIAAGASAVFVSDIRVTALSHITVTFTSDPGDAPGIQSDAGIKWVERNPDFGFTVHATRLVGPATSFTYLIVEP